MSTPQQRRSVRLQQQPPQTTSSSQQNSGKRKKKAAKKTGEGVSNPAQAQAAQAATSFQAPPPERMSSVQVAQAILDMNGSGSSQSDDASESPTGAVSRAIAAKDTTLPPMSLRSYREVKPTEQERLVAKDKLSSHIVSIFHDHGKVEKQKKYFKVFADYAVASYITLPPHPFWHPNKAQGWAATTYGVHRNKDGRTRVFDMESTDYASCIKQEYIHGQITLNAKASEQTKKKSSSAEANSTSTNETRLSETEFNTQLKRLAEQAPLSVSAEEAARLDKRIEKLETTLSVYERDAKDVKDAELSVMQCAKKHKIAIAKLVHEVKKLKERMASLMVRKKEHESKQEFLQEQIKKTQGELTTLRLKKQQCKKSFDVGKALKQLVDGEVFDLTTSGDVFRDDTFYKDLGIDDWSKYFSDSEMDVGGSQQISKPDSVTPTKKSNIDEESSSKNLKRKAPDNNSQSSKPHKKAKRRVKLRGSSKKTTKKQNASERQSNSEGDSDDIDDDDDESSNTSDTSEDEDSNDDDSNDDDDDTSGSSAEDEDEPKTKAGAQPPNPWGWGPDMNNTKRKIHNWQRKLSQKHWKKVTLLAPYCRTCQGLNNYPHTGSEQCMKARAYTKKVRNYIQQEEAQQRKELRKLQANVRKAARQAQNIYKKKSKGKKTSQ